jgi:hypothetical protein
MSKVSAREHYESRKLNRPIQVTAPTTDHVIGWNWPKVGDNTLEEFDEILGED